MNNVKHTALVTGANSGVGLELTRLLLSQGWDVVALIRSNFPGEPMFHCATKQQKLRIYKVDMANFTLLRDALTMIKEKERAIDVIFNNAGVMLDKSVLSPQSRDVHFEVHTLAPYIILEELKPLLLAGSLKIVVNTSSNTLLMVKRFDPAMLQRPAEFRKILGPYAATKLALSLWTQEAAASNEQRDIKILSVCPGSNKTKMNAGSAVPVFLVPIRNLFFPHPRKGASKLYEAMVNANSYSSGDFINKGKATPLPFRKLGKEVFDMVDQIYRREYL